MNSIATKVLVRSIVRREALVWNKIPLRQNIRKNWAEKKTKYRSI